MGSGCVQWSPKGCGAQTEVSEGLQGGLECGRRMECSQRAASCPQGELPAVPKEPRQPPCPASPGAMLQARKIPGRCGSLRLPRQQRRGAAISAVPGEEEAPAEMDLNLEESLGRAFRDKLRLP